MSVDIRSSDRRRYMIELQAREKEIAAGLLKASQPSSPNALQENEKRMRREIANSNERRRMQCINAGFSSLRALIPQLEGEKLSKAAILQHATEYISSLEKDKSRLQKQLEHTKELLVELGQDRVVTETYMSSSPPPSKRKKRDTESSDEGVCSLSDASDDGGSELQQANVALRHQVEVERQRYSTLEEQFRLLETELLALLRVRACHNGSPSEVTPVSPDHHEIQNEYKRQVSDLATSREVVAASPRFDNFQPPRPVSPVLDQGMTRETSPSADFPAQRPLVIDTTRYNTVELMEVVSESDKSLSSALPPTDQHSFQHHNYCHRDHPRRRHRQQAQLEQQRIEEENRRQQQLQQEITAATVYLPRPKENTQNLERLVEAIRQIEGDHGDEHRFFYKGQQHNVANEESERETSSISDQDELKSENYGRDSPLHLHHHDKQHQQKVTNEKLTVCGISNSVNFSEKYPIASHLLHRPHHPSCYRPGVIVHKQ